MGLFGRRIERLNQEEIRRRKEENEARVKLERRIDELRNKWQRNELTPDEQMLNIRLTEEYHRKYGLPSDERSRKHIELPPDTGRKRPRAVLPPDGSEYDY